MDEDTIESAFLEIRKEQKEMMRKIDRIAYTVGVSMEFENDLLGTSDVCDMLKISDRTLTRMKRDGEIGYSIVKRRCVYRRSDVEKIVRDNRKCL